jgi:tetratricopeptide (TPR) repeat protein
VTRNVAAHERYVRASDPVALRSDSSARVALAQFEQAVALDDRYAAAYAGLALMQLRVPADSVVSHRERLALAEARRALELDPLSPTAVAEVAHALLANDRCDEALAQLAPLQSLRPPLLRAGSIAVQCYARKAMWPDAIAAAQPIARLGGARGRSLLGWALGRAGHSEEAHSVLDSLIADDRRTEGAAFDVAVVYAGLGDTDQAFAWLDRAANERSIVLHHHFGLISGLASDPRFDRFRGRLRIARR